MFEQSLCSLNCFHKRFALSNPQILKKSCKFARNLAAALFSFSFFFAVVCKPHRSVVLSADLPDLPCAHVSESSYL
jgi:hypothetical protein